MQYKAVIFDLFETLITEWGHKKYTKNEMCEDLGIGRAEFDIFWDEKALDKYGKVYDVVYTNFVGTIVYEDDWQVAVKVEDGKMV